MWQGKVLLFVNLNKAVLNYSQIFFYIDLLRGISFERKSVKVYQKSETEENSASKHLKGQL